MTSATLDGGARPEPRRVDYHFHTEFSYDSRTPAEAVLERAREAKLEVLCVTDHDTIEGALALERISGRDVQIVVGCEFTCEDGSHVIGLGLRDMIAERRIPALLEEIHGQGGLVLLPHLFRRGSGIFRHERKRSEEFVREVLSRADLVECFNGRDTYEKNLQAYRFVTTRGLAAVAGSDAHRPSEIGSVWVEYGQGGFVDGVSPRRIAFPAQEPSLENPVKRRVMELYHQHQARFPQVIRKAHRMLRSRLARDLRAGGGAPRIQYTFPPSAGADGRGA